MPTSFLDKTGLSYLFSKIDAKYLNKSGTALKTSAIPFAHVDSTSTSTAYTATVPEITSLYDGVAVLLKNGVVTSEAGFTININGLGAKHAYNNMTAATAESTIFNINYTMLFVYDSTRVDGGGWICYRGYDELPAVTTADNDKVLCVVNGAWSKQSLPSVFAGAAGRYF